MAVLLVVYAFIATPVQLWHNHNYVTDIAHKQSANEKVQLTFFEAPSQAIDSNCQMCSHHYSVYSITTAIGFKTPFIISQLKREYYKFSIPSSTQFNFSNKGPPAIV